AATPTVRGASTGAWASIVRGRGLGDGARLPATASAGARLELVAVEVDQAVCFLVVGADLQHAGGDTVAAETDVGLDQQDVALHEEAVLLQALVAVRPDHHLRLAAEVLDRHGSEGLALLRLEHA